jgi:hypothetical protein
MASPFTAPAKAASSSKRENASDHFVDSAAAFGHFRLDAKTAKCSKRTNAEKNKNHEIIVLLNKGKRENKKRSVHECRVVA